MVPFALFNTFVRGGVLEGDPYFYQLALGFFIMIWCNDTGAYLFGKAFGKHKLFERISPNKTWQGTIGGVLLTVGFAVLWSYIWDRQPFQDLWIWMPMAVIVAVFGGLGDLVESLFKRRRSDPEYHRARA